MQALFSLSLGLPWRLQIRLDSSRLVLVVCRPTWQSLGPRTFNLLSQHSWGGIAGGEAGTLPRP